MQKLIRSLQRLFAAIWENLRSLIQALFKQPRQRHRESSAQRSRRSMAEPGFGISWVIPGKLAVGPLPKRGDETLLHQENIRAVVTLCAEKEGSLPETLIQTIACQRYVLPDSHYDVEMTAEQLAQAIELVQTQIQNYETVYVHCLAGMERSPTVCVGYLCRYHRLELWEAINWVKQVHPRTALSEAQLKALRLLGQVS